MAQHYLLSEENEPNIFRSVARIGQYFERSYRYMTSLRKDFYKNIIYRKEVVKLSDEYKIHDNTKFVLQIGKYDLQNSNWWTSAVDGKKDMFSKQYDYSDLHLECHLDDKGKIIAIYMVA